MKVRLMTVSAGPTHNLAPGVHDLAPDFAQALCEAGHAVPVTEEVIETATVTPAERRGGPRRNRPRED